MKFALAFILFCPALLFAEEAVPNPLLDLAQYQKIAREIEPIRQKRLLSVAQFKAMSAEPGTVVIDTRAAEKFALRHIRGAVSVPCTAFSADTLAKAIPAKDSRVLVYGDMNFRGTPVPGLGTAIQPYTTVYFALATYGYENVHELGLILDLAKSGLPFEGTEVAVQFDSGSAVEKTVPAVDKALLGVWELSYDAYANGMEWVEASRRGPAWQWEFTTTELIFDPWSGPEQKSSYRLDPAQAGAIDLCLDPEKPEKVSLGIYKLEGDKLIVCIGQERPTDFSPASGGRRYHEFVRAKPVPAAVKAILGIWKLSNDESVNGKEWRPAVKRSLAVEWQFTDKDLIIDPRYPKTHARKGYRLDSAGPGTIDVLFEKTSLGIYKLEGGKLIICVGKEGGNERPMDFSPASPAERRLEFVRAEPVPEAVKALLGVWELSNDEAVSGGEWHEMARRGLAWQWKFTAAELIFDPWRRGFVRKGAYRFDPAQAGAIDLWLDPEKPEKISLGIYKLEGEKLIVCLGKEGKKERPTDFSPTSPAARRYEFVRAKPVPAAVNALLGVWKLSNDEYVNGKEWRGMRSPAVEWEFADDRLIIDRRNSDKAYNTKGYRLDPAGPGTIDVQLQLKVGLGIYKLEGDKLIICLGKEGGSERLADFSPASPAERRLEFVRQPVP